jgi:hypothetical protein
MERVILDSNVIYSRVLHELMGRLGSSARFYDLIWSDELLGEAQRVLEEDKPLSPHAAARWVGHMRREFPAGRVDISGVEHQYDLSTFTKDEGIITWLPWR